MLRMPFDPSLPAPNSPLESQVIRDQLQALFVLIHDIVSVTAAQVDGVNTLDNPYADPEGEELRQKVNELINALRR